MKILFLTLCVSVLQMHQCVVTDASVCNQHISVRANLNLIQFNDCLTTSWAP